VPLKFYFNLKKITKHFDCINSVAVVVKKNANKRTFIFVFHVTFPINSKYY